ncbi:family S53 protease-like protein [Roridomyces roridus]|uniref:tripeptidyl-peptidase II n=1 Tax=Roridomyces roridus TaxID=1738132 RepID=A0AAD7B795_9AGAR|nr:family S53 protease-like protein [Roridomyces roridus]
MTLLRLLVAVLPAICIASAERLVVHERRATAPQGFVNHGAAQPTEMLSLRLALAPNNAAGLDAKLTSISTPGSPEFRKWLSMEEVKSYVEPSAETFSALEIFASANGLEYQIISPNGDWASIQLPVSQANQLFNTQFDIFSHPSMDQTITRTLSVSMPASLVGHVEVIHPTTDFSAVDARLLPGVKSPGKRQASSCDTSNAAGVITPACLQSFYGIPAAPATDSSANHLVVTAYQGEYAQNADLSVFFKQFRTDIPSNTTFNLLSLDGGVNSQGANQAGTEANLDVQYTAGIATGVPVDFLSVGTPSASFTTSLLDTTTYLDGVANPPTVITTSYGGNENSFGLSLATRICDGYKSLGARGISVVFASGDGGVRGGHDTTSVCSVTTFIPVFPASCPYVTSVGSTQGFAPEKAINFTGGGFSNYFPTPDYQTSAVSTFLQTGIPANFGGTFNKSGRGYPDVAVQGWNFGIVDGGETGTVGGTSASSPTFAAIISLINDKLIAAGKPVLGFLNPFLYSTAQNAFNDITIGHNAGFVCSASLVAFDAAVGWDPLTGWGSPKFDDLLAAAMAA